MLTFAIAGLALGLGRSFRIHTENAAQIPTSSAAGSDMASVALIGLVIVIEARPVISMPARTAAF